MRTAGAVALVALLAYLAPLPAAAGELTDEQARLEGLRAFKVIVNVAGEVPVSAEELRNEVEVFLRMRKADILLVEKNYDAFLVVTVTAGYSKNLMEVRFGNYGVIKTSVIDWAFQDRHLNDVLSVHKDDYIFLAHIWKREDLFFNEDVEPENITDNLKENVRDHLASFLEDYHQANPP